MFAHWTCRQFSRKEDESPPRSGRAGTFSLGPGGDLVFAGTEVPVREFVDSLKSGEPLNDFTGHRYTAVTREQTVAFLEWALAAANDAAYRPQGNW